MPGLVLLHKGPDKPVSNSSSFRPLCMLDTAGKLLERILLQRLNAHLDVNGGLSPNEFGSRKGPSTKDAFSKVLEMAGGLAMLLHNTKNYASSSHWMLGMPSTQLLGSR